MKIQYCSDLHIEFPENKEYLINNPIKPIGDILVLAGDIALFRTLNEQDDFFDYVSANFKYTFWIAGNHEYYHSDISKFKNKDIRENVFLINNKSVVFEKENLKLIFTTLWSNVEDENIWSVGRGMNDFRVIENGDNGLTVNDYNSFHKESLDFIKNELDNNKQEKIVVVTHHVPTLINYPKEYINSPINNGFATELKDFIESSDIDYWIFGHHHKNMPEFTIGKTKMLTNQLGYVYHNEHDSYKNNAFFEI